MKSSLHASYVAKGAVAEVQQGRESGKYFMAECHIHDKPTMPC